MAYQSLPVLIEELEEIIASDGVHAALGFLNSRAPHRFTGVYRLDGGTLRNVRLFDRENPVLEVGVDAPLRETYCSVTAGGEAPFSTADTRADERLLQHPARESTLSYCGVPLRDGTGAVVGTLCHFDLVPRSIPVAEVPFLEAAAPRILAALQANNAFVA